MKSRPILYNGEMVRALLNGAKTQTRRIMKPQTMGFRQQTPNQHPTTRTEPYIDAYCGEKKTQKNPRGMGVDWHWWTADNRLGDKISTCPFGQPGDQLWVRETWADVPASAYRCSQGVQQTVCPTDPDMAAIYAAGWDRSPPGRWRPSIHMPRWASRITLEITNIRVERLREITEAEAKAEGAVPDPDHPFADTHNCLDAFEYIWNSLYDIPSWNQNPYVWVIEFKRITP